jgi:hypothetical protein
MNEMGRRFKIGGVAHRISTKEWESVNDQGTKCAKRNKEK